MSLSCSSKIYSPSQDLLTNWQYCNSTASFLVPLIDKMKTITTRRHLTSVMEYIP